MKAEVKRRLRNEAKAFMEEYNQERECEKKINLKEAIAIYGHGDVIEQIESEIEEELKQGETKKE